MFNLVKVVFFDVLILYKNFIHWNISKLTIYFYSICLWILFSLPLIFIYLVFSIFSWESFLFFLSSLISWKFINNIFWLVIHIFIAVLYVLWFLYSYLLLLNLNLSYLKWEKLPYLKNRFLDKKLIIKYILLTLSVFLIILIPFFFFIIVFFLLLFLFWWLENIFLLFYSSPINWFSITLLLFFIVSVIASIYCFFRIIFSYFLLLEDKKNEKNPVFLLKESFNLTKWFNKFISSLILFILFWFFYSIFSYIWADNNLKYSEIKSYQNYIQSDEITREQLKSENTFYYVSLELKYQDHDSLSIDNLVNRYYWSVVFFKIFNFLLLYWFLSMLLTSIYLRVIWVNNLKKETKIQKIVKKLSFKNKEL